MGKQDIMERFICRYIETPPTHMYDIGIGPKTEWKTLLEIYPQMAVHGCEPLVDLYPILEFFPGHVHPIAIGPYGQDKITIHFNPIVKMGASVIPSEKLTESRTVPCWSLDEFDFQMIPTQDLEHDRILLWMDIEGTELTALKSGKELLSSGRVKWINLEERNNEDVPDGWCSPKEIELLLGQYGYNKVCCYNEHEKHRDCIYIYEDEIQ